MADAATPGDSKDDGKKGEQETLVPDLDKQERKLQDCLCLLLFIVALLGWLLLAIMVTNDGCPDDCNDPMKLVYGFDSEGCMCGKDCTSKGGPDNTGKKRLYIPDPRDTGLRMCLESCPPEFAFNKSSAVSAGVYRCPDKVCTQGLTADQQKTCKDEGVCEKLFYMERDPAYGAKTLGKLDNCFLPTANTSDCWYPTYPTTDVFFKCIPTLPTMDAETTAQLELAGLPAGSGEFGNSLGALSNPGGEVGTWTAELNQTYVLLIIAFVVAFAMGFTFLMLMRSFAVPIVYLSTIGLLVVSLGASLFLWDRAGVIPVFSTIDSKVGSNVTAMAEAAGESAGSAGTDTGLVGFFAGVLTLFTIVYIVFVVVMFKKILVAVRVVNEACKALAAMPLLTMQPACTMIALVCLYLWTAVITMYFMSAGEFDPATGQFVYAGGDCSNIESKDAPMRNLNHTATLAILTLTLSSTLTSTNTKDGPLTITHNQLKGTQCTTTGGLTRCKVNVNVSSNEDLPIGSCLGDKGNKAVIDSQGYGKACDEAKATAQLVTGKNNRRGTVQWIPEDGSVKLFVAEPYKTIAIPPVDVTPELKDVVKLALPLQRCSDATPASCEMWQSITGTVKDAANNTVGTWMLKTEKVFSNYNVTKAEAMRACNQVGGQVDKAVKKFQTSKVAALEKQGKADLNEVKITYAIKNITLDNWKSVLPVSLDGSTYKYFGLYHLFMFLWFQEFLVASGYYVTVGAVAAWYWSTDKASVGTGLGSATIMKSLKRYVRYNLGTVIFGALIIAIVQLIRILMNYYLSQMEKLEKNEAMKKVIAVMKCLVNCCLWCLEKFIGFINKKAYIMSATHGMSFCKGAFRGFLLVLRNILQIAAVSVITPAIMFFGKFFICLSTFVIVYLASVQNAAQLDLQNGPPILTLFISIIIAYGVADTFMSVVEAATDCIMLSYLHDKEVNNGKDKPYVHADAIMGVMGGQGGQVAPS